MAKWSSYRIIALIILFLIFVGFSFWMTDYMVKVGYGQWWILLVAGGFIWLLYVVVAYGILEWGAQKT